MIGSRILRPRYGLGNGQVSNRMRFGPRLAAATLLAVAVSVPIAAVADDAAESATGSASAASYSIGLAAPYNGSTYVDYSPEFPVAPVATWTSGRLSLFLAGVSWRLFEGNTGSPESEHGAGADIAWSLSPVLNIGLMPRDEDESPRFDGMTERDTETTVGVIAELSAGIGDLSIVALQDVGGASDGATGTATFTRPLVLGQRFQLGGNVGIELASADHVDYYYGVRPEEATAVRAAYRAGSAVNPFVGLSAGYALAAHWRLASEVQVLRLDDDIVDSSLTNDDEVELRATVALSYVSQR